MKDSFSTWAGKLASDMRPFKGVDMPHVAYFPVLMPQGKQMLPSFFCMSYVAVVARLIF